MDPMTSIPIGATVKIPSVALVALPLLRILVTTVQSFLVPVLRDNHRPPVLYMIPHSLITDISIVTRLTANTSSARMVEPMTTLMAQK